MCEEGLKEMTCNNCLVISDLAPKSFWVLPDEEVKFCPYCGSSDFYTAEEFERLRLEAERLADADIEHKTAEAAALAERRVTKTGKHLAFLKTEFLGAEIRLRREGNEVVILQDLNGITISGDFPAATVLFALEAAENHKVYWELLPFSSPPTLISSECSLSLEQVSDIVCNNS